MSTVTLNSSSQTYPSYLDNVSVAARSLIAALLAVKPAAVQAQKTVAGAKAVSVTRAPSLRELYRLSAGSDSVNMKAVAGLEAIAAHR